ncbi:hypothetical protein N657DRAFT_326476 [Parathielavia appendiculata]|uniref:Uncharacterized protein n=1 Tax=Parathielavia appendiculata TaxID=2587402 RepID=A0AAN6TRJ8_9PEZI|nr:hypothetical protein N657DRAFT_326476 [Parathielavia appendiculata]
MYHTREASDSRDKVYALLGMSSDRQQYPQLLPDYRTSLGDLLRTFINSVVSEQLEVTTWDDEEFCVIEGRGYVAGVVSVVQSDRMMHDRQRIDVSLIVGSTQRAQETRWTLPPLAKQIRSSDLICILQDASTPTIIMPHADYCEVIAISVPMGIGEQWPPGFGNVHVDPMNLSTTGIPYNLLLSWDRKMSGQNGEAEAVDFASLVRKQLPKHSQKTEVQDWVKGVTRWQNTGRLVGDLNEWEDAQLTNLREELELLRSVTGSGTY